MVGLYICTLPDLSILRAKNMRTCMPRISCKIRSSLHILQTLDLINGLKTIVKTRTLAKRSGSMNYTPIQSIALNPNLLAQVEQVPGEAELG